ncbi:MAG: response regulator [Bacteroidetes bacterium]|nr:response regulator [Bacteroidota bacterium]
MTRTIIVADDQVQNIAAILSMLATFDKELRVIGAVNGKIACEQALAKNPDLVILDWEMPVMTGIEAVRFLKDNEKTKNIPIIMATALTSSEHLSEAMEAGAMDYIRKPLDRIELIARVRSALTIYDYYRKIKQQAEELSAKNAELKKLSIVASETDNSVLIMSREGEIEWANEGFRRMYEYSLPEFKDKVGTTVFEASNSREINQTVRRCINEKQSEFYLTQTTTKTGKIKYIQTTLTPIIGEDGETEKLIAIESDITRIKEQEVIIMQEKEKSETLLLNILPKETARELKEKGSATPRMYRRTTVMFTDFINFTKACEGLSPQELVDELHLYFAHFDDIMEKHYLEKIKTIGDAYMCAGGLPIRNNSHAINAVMAGMEIQRFIKDLNEKRSADGKTVWNLRCGIHSGPVVAGVVGKKKFAYDIWGDSVNIAARMEQSGEPGRVNISETTYEFIREYFECEYRGKINAKNKGKIDMYFVIGLKEEFSVDEKGIEPNDRFSNIIRQL